MSICKLLPRFHPSASLKNRTNFNIINSILSINQQLKYLSAKAPVVKQVDPNTGEVKKKKTAVVPKITLLSGASITLTTLEEAEKMARRRDLKLVKIVDLDTKTQRPIYKLMTGAEYHAEDLKQREKRKEERLKGSIKGEKVLLLSARITEHDLETQARRAIKWVEKMYEVRVVINGDRENPDVEKVYSTIESFFKKSGCDARFVQKQKKDSDIKCQIIPPRKKNEEDDAAKTPNTL